MNSTKKILFIIDSLGGGGAERVLTNIVNGIDRKKYKPIVCLSMGKRVDFSIKEDVDVCNLEPIYDIHQVRRYRRFVRRIVFFRTIRCLLTGKKLFDRKRLYNILIEFCPLIIGLRSIVKRYCPDLIMTVLFNSSLIGSLYCQFYRDSTLLCTSDHNTLSLEIRRLFPLFEFILPKIVLSRADRYVAVSEGVKSDLIDLYDYPSNQIDTIYNGIEIDMIHFDGTKPLSADIPSETIFKSGPVIVTVGRLTLQKAQDVLLRAFHMVLTRCDCNLVIIGEGERLEELQRLVSDLRIDRNVFFLGWRHDVYSIMSKCDVFVLSSLYEAFPMVLLEAMALGLPVVSTNCPYGPVETLAGGIYGTLVPTGDVQALAGVLVDLVNDKQKRDEMGERSCVRARDFSSDSMIAQYESLFQRLIGC